MSITPHHEPEGIPRRSLPERYVHRGERLFERIAETTPHVLFVFHLVDARFTYVNAASERVIGYSPDALYAMDRDVLRRIVLSDDLPGLREDIAAARVVSDGVRLEREVRVLGPDRRLRWVRYRSVVLSRGSDGRGIEALGEAEDITESKEREEALRRSEERYRLATKAVRGLVYEIDLASGQVEYSRGVSELLGPTGDEFPPTMEAWQERVHPEDRARITALLADHLARGVEALEAEYRIRHEDGTYHFVWDRALVQKGATGVPERIIGCVVDVTDHVRAQRALEEADRRKDDFLAMLGHELRNPLTPIRNATDLLRLVGPTEGPIRRVSDILERQVAHMARLVDDLLDVSRISRGKVWLRREFIDLAEIVVREVTDQRKVVESRSIELSLHVPDEPVWVDADPTRIAQIVDNLLSNASKFTDPGGAIVVRLACDLEKSVAILTVADEGIGIAPDVLPTLFDVFMQADRTLERARGGLGLGLPLVKGLVELHGGSVSAASEGIGRGATFTVELPLKGGGARRVEGRGHPELGPLTTEVLVIEDNADAAESLRLVLEALGCRVAIAENGRAGIEAARAQLPDVVVCDIGLPGMNGYDVARAFRRDPRLGGVRLIAMTGYGQTRDRERALDAGFDDHLTKPASLDCLRPLLRRPS